MSFNDHCYCETVMKFDEEEGGGEKGMGFGQFGFWTGFWGNVDVDVRRRRRRTISFFAINELVFVLVLVLVVNNVVSRDAHEKGKVEMKERKLMGKLKALNYFTKPDIYHNEISLD